LTCAFSQHPSGRSLSVTGTHYSSFQAREGFDAFAFCSTSNKQLFFSLENSGSPFPNNDAFHHDLRHCLNGRESLMRHLDVPFDQ